jgi:hypothetical protein
MKSEAAIGEKRTAKRYSFTVAVMLHELSQDQKTVGRPIGCVSRNASENGMCVSTAVPLMHSAVVRCDISMGDVPVSVPTLAQIRWVERVSGGEYRTGLAYIF